jgi:hypothetical protein
VCEWKTQGVRETAAPERQSRGASLADRKGMSQIRVFDYVNRPFGQVSTELQTDTGGIIQRATTVAGERARELGAKLHAHVGPVDVTADVTIEIGPMDETPMGSGRPALRIPIAWHAIRTPQAFPVMHAELLVYPLTPTETQLELVGTYEPPLGPVGRAIDAALLHDVARGSVLQFIQEIARYLREDLADVPALYLG